jgi:thiol-disulfide isomerase/thioredoxin
MKRRLIGIVILFLVVIGMPAGHPAQAQDDIESQINALAAKVHRFNVGSGTFTEWAGGRLGKRTEFQPRYIAVGDELPNLSLKGLGGTKTTRLSTIAGPALLNIWASWCPPCRDEFPLLTKTALDDAAPMKIYFVNTRDTQRAANSFLRTQRKGINVLFDGEPYNFLASVGIKVYPSSFLIDKDGKITLIHMGEIQQQMLDFLELIAANPDVGSYDSTGVVPLAKPLALDNAMPLVPGLAYEGRLDGGLNIVPYRFNGVAGQELTFVMRAEADIFNEDAVDPYLLIVNADGEILAWDDDGAIVESGITDRFGNDIAGSAVDAIVRFTPDADGEYYVIVTRAGYEDGFNRGTYRFIAIDEAAFF